MPEIIFAIACVVVGVGRRLVRRSERQGLSNPDAGGPLPKFGSGPSQPRGTSQPGASRQTGSPSRSMPVGRKPART